MSASAVAAGGGGGGRRLWRWVRREELAEEVRRLPGDCGGLDGLAALCVQSAAEGLLEPLEAAVERVRAGKRGGEGWSRELQGRAVGT